LLFLPKHTCGRCEIVSGRYDLAYISSSFSFYIFFLVCFFSVANFKYSTIFNLFSCSYCLSQNLKFPTVFHFIFIFLVFCLFVFWFFLVLFFWGGVTKYHRLCLFISGMTLFNYTWILYSRNVSSYRVVNYMSFLA